MPRKRTNTQDIRNKQHYFAAYVKYENMHDRAVRKRINANELSVGDSDYFSRASVNQNNELYEDIFGWIESIQDERLHRILRALTDEQKEMLTLAAIDELTQREIAEMYGIKQQSVATRFSTIKNKVRKIYKKSC